MRRHVTVLVLLLASLVSARSASAQDRSVGLTMAYPASAGLLWHVSESVALRPEVSFLHSSNESETNSPIGVGESSSDGNTFQVGLSALFYLARWDMLRAYVVPRYAYSRSSSSIEGPLSGLNIESTSTGHSGGVSFGAQHALGERFAIFGELGLSYDQFTTELTTTEVRRNTFGTRSGVGVVVYF